MRRPTHRSCTKTSSSEQGARHGNSLGVLDDNHNELPPTSSHDHRYHGTGSVIGPTCSLSDSKSITLPFGTTFRVCGRPEGLLFTPTGTGIRRVPIKSLGRQTLPTVRKADPSHTSHAWLGVDRPACGFSNPMRVGGCLHGRVSVPSGAGRTPMKGRGPVADGTKTMIHAHATC